MSGRRENFTKDRQKNHPATKENHKKQEVRTKQQAAVLSRLWAQAKAEGKK